MTCSNEPFFLFWQKKTYKIGEITKPMIQSQKKGTLSLKIIDNRDQLDQRLTCFFVCSSRKQRKYMNIMLKRNKKWRHCCVEKIAYSRCSGIITDLRKHQILFCFGFLSYRANGSIEKVKQKRGRKGKKIVQETRAITKTRWDFMRKMILISVPIARTIMRKEREREGED